MVDVWKITPSGHLVIRKPSGAITFNTAQPMPAQIGEDVFTGVTVAFENIAGTSIGGSAGNLYFSVPAADETANQTLGAYSGSGTPDIIWARARFREEPAYGTTLGNTLRGFFVTNLVDIDPSTLPPIVTSWPYTDWIAWPGGSIMMGICTGDNEPIRIWRHMHVLKSGSNWVLQKRQSSSAFNTNGAADPGDGFRQQWTMDIRIAYGVLKTGV